MKIALPAKKFSFSCSKLEWREVGTAVTIGTIMIAHHPSHSARLYRSSSKLKAPDALWNVQAIFKSGVWKHFGLAFWQYAGTAGLELIHTYSIFFFFLHML